MRQNACDVIVVGSVLGGCGAAALLAKDRGKKVLVRENRPDGSGRYFVGDPNGRRIWGGVDDASLCAVMGVDKIMVTRLKFDRFPKYRQGISVSAGNWGLGSALEASS